MAGSVDAQSCKGVKSPWGITGRDGKRRWEPGSAPGASLNTQTPEETQSGGHEMTPLSTHPAERWLAPSSRALSGLPQRPRGMRGQRRMAGMGPHPGESRYLLVPQ